MKIAILAYGSLIADPRNLRITHEGWKKSNLQIPLEFSRVSKDGRLTIVIDEKNGQSNEVSYATSAFTDLNSAINNFVEREGINREDQLGLIVVNGYRNPISITRILEKFPKSCEWIRQWALEEGFDAVVFSGLGIRFKDKLGIDFSVAHAYNYVNFMRNTERKRIAYNYIVNVPENIVTPFRTLFNQRTVRDIVLNS